MPSQFSPNRAYDSAPSSTTASTASASMSRERKPMAWRRSTAAAYVWAVRARNGTRDLLIPQVHERRHEHVPGLPAPIGVHAPERRLAAFDAPTDDRFCRDAQLGRTGQPGVGEKPELVSAVDVTVASLDPRAPIDERHVQR